jgi:hypothetical protein
MKNINISFIDLLKNTLINDLHIGKFYVKKFPNSKYSLDDIINEIMYILKTGIPYRCTKSSIKWNSIYFHFNRFVKYDIF